MTHDADAIVIGAGLAAWWRPPNSRPLAAGSSWSIRSLRLLLACCFRALTANITEQFQGSSFLNSLNAAPTAASVQYVVIETRDDEVVTPYTNAFLPAGPNVQNITLQNQCAQDGSDHLSIPYDSNALQDMINALGAGSQSFQPTCASVGPIFGNV